MGRVRRLERCGLGRAEHQLGSGLGQWAEGHQAREGQLTSMLARLPLSILLAISCGVSPAWSQAATTSLTARASRESSAALDSARSLMLAGMRRSGIPGASITVLR